MKRSNTSCLASSKRAMAELPPLVAELETKMETVEPSRRGFGPLLDSQFEQWWKLYPRKVGGKNAARKAWDRAVNTASDSVVYDELVAALTGFARVERRLIPRPCEVAEPGPVERRTGTRGNASHRGRYNTRPGHHVEVRGGGRAAHS